jgi:hypothetical protein
VLVDVDIISVCVFALADGLEVFDCYGSLCIVSGYGELKCMRRTIVILDYT